MAAKKKTTRKSSKKAKSGTRRRPAAKAADPTEVRTIVYIHGLANKPKPSVLKCQWDTALFRAEMGDRTRMAYWVDPEVHGTPKEATCSDPDTVEVPPEDLEPEGARIRSVGLEDDWLEEEARKLATSDEERQLLEAMGGRLVGHGEKVERLESRGPGVKVLPLPAFLRRRITRAVTKQFLRDAFNFFFVDERRERMERIFRERLPMGGEPVVVIAHSQGTMIAYNVLRKLKKTECNVRLFVTIGSPLGLTEVKDLFRARLFKPRRKGKLPVPPCVERWVNITDKADVVALDETLSKEYSPKGFIKDIAGKRLNEDSPAHPHSATGYLRSEEVRATLREVVGASFGTLLSDFVIARDLATAIENDRRGRHRVLIQLVEPEKAGGGKLADTRSRVIDSIAAIVGETEGIEADDARAEALAIAKVDPLRRFVAAELTAAEVERLSEAHTDLSINRLWANSRKSALVTTSAQTIQVEPARIGYQARGQGITWAVLDTGIDASHPHFKREDGTSTIEEEWDCTQTGPPVAGGPDRHGHGTHVAGIIAGSHHQGGATYRGMAPSAGLITYKVLGDDGSGQDSWVIKALEDVGRKNEDAGALVIQGVNLSLGGPFDPGVYGCGHSPICQELRRLWRQGVVVCLAAGNEGYAQLYSSHGLIDANVDLSIGDPANLEEAIAVGSVHKGKPHTYGVSYFSSRGPTADGRLKPDVVAPGEKILSARARVPRNGPREPLYVAMDGTSMAAPHVSGMIADFLSVRREFIGYPDKVKQILLANCIDLGRDRYIQGHGMPNLIKMLANT